MYPDLVQAEKAGGENAYKVLAEKKVLGLLREVMGTLFFPILQGSGFLLMIPMQKG